MSKTLVAAMFAAVLSAGALAANRAEAMTLAAPAGARAAIDQTSSVEKARYVCYRVWRRGRLREECSWRPTRRYYGYPYHYGYYRPYPYYYHSPYAYRRPGVSFHFRF